MWNSARRRLVGYIPAPDASPELVARLARQPADELLDLVCDPRETWWRRRPCALALRGRVPPAGVPRLIARVRDVKDVAEVRRAILEALGDAELGPHAGELLEWLRAARSPRSVTTCRRRSCSPARACATPRPRRSSRGSPPIHGRTGGSPARPPSTS
ncbi:hypothetical protein OV079_52315 [Nannocystis pusilla]|uniref:Uncharacterized protein n=1 Tax=Nannocystis pusilla TaxID=889268 RepID=A0A9X3F3T0_9BACT|nr:hypothetical protein [Nannocystis pusilla]MCY1013974.1 hypothetical protein [Nannocystis pusilla]